MSEQVRMQVKYEGDNSIRGTVQYRSISAALYEPSIDFIRGRGYLRFASGSTLL